MYKISTASWRKSARSAAIPSVLEPESLAFGSGCLGLPLRWTVIVNCLSPDVCSETWSFVPESFLGVAPSASADLKTADLSHNPPTALPMATLLRLAYGAPKHAIPQANYDT